MSRRPVTAFVVLAALLAGASPATAQPAPPPLTAPVNDFAGVIDAATERELDRRIRGLQTATGDVIVVATVRTIQPFGTIEEYAVRMFENQGSGIGDRGRDNGALVLVAMDERQVRIEVGYDLEEFVPDGYAGETIRTVMRPEFQRGNYSRGILLGTTRLVERIAERRNVVLTDRQPDAPGRGIRVPWFPVLFLLLLLLMGRGGPRRRRRRWGGGPWSGWHSGVGTFGGGMFGGGFGGFGGGFGGGSGGGGFGGFGGGRSGGGGASGGW